MFFLDVMDKDKEYRFYYYKCDNNIPIKSHTYKTTDLKKLDISSTNAIMYRFFYNLHDKDVFIVDEKTINILNEIYRGQHVFHKENYVVYSDFYNWCVEQSKDNLDIKNRLDKFETMKETLEKRSYFESFRMRAMMEFYNLVYLDYKEEYHKSKCVIKNEEQRVLESKNINTYHLIDTESTSDFEFLENIEVNNDDLMVFFVNNNNKSLKFTTLLKILKHKNLEFEIENYNISILIQSYLLSLDNVKQIKFKIYTSSNNLTAITYLKNRSNLDIEIIDTNNIIADFVSDNEATNDDAFDISICILDDDDDEDI